MIDPDVVLAVDPSRPPQPARRRRSAYHLPRHLAVSSRPVHESQRQTAKPSRTTFPSLIGDDWSSGDTKLIRHNASPTCRSRRIMRPSHHLTFHAISAVAPRFVPKSVPKRRLPITPADDEVRAAMMCRARRLGPLRLIAGVGGEPLLAVFADSATRATPAPIPRCGSPPTKPLRNRISSSRPSAQANCKWTESPTPLFAWPSRSAESRTST
jgi:hypothetical protein